MRRFFASIMAIGLLAGCTSDGKPDPDAILQLALQAVVDTVETVYVRGKITAEEATAITTTSCTLRICEVGDRILKGDQIDGLKNIQLPGFLDKVRDRAIQLVHDTCTKGYLTEADAATLSGLGAMTLDPIFDHNCSELVKRVTGT